MFGSNQADLINISLGDILAENENGSATVNLSGLTSADTVNVVGGSELDPADATKAKNAIEAGIASGNDGKVTVTHDYSGGKVTVAYDTVGTELDYSEIYTLI